MADDGRRRITGRHVLFLLLGFFGLIMAVNGVFVYVALDSYSGLTTEHAYKKGLAYNETLEDSRAQQALGWRLTMESEWRGVSEPTRIVVRIADAHGAPLSGLRLVGEMRRPAEAHNDRAVSFVDLGGGQYETLAALPYLGNWDLYLTATRGDGAELKVERRLWLKSTR